MIYLFGSTGMLGNYVRIVLSKNFEVKCITRDDFDIFNDTWSKLLQIIATKLQKDDVIVNCAGIIPQKTNNEFKKYIKVNTLFPHKLQHIAENFNAKLIHISTNCVFDGKEGTYKENFKANDDSIYGTTKYLGEPENATIIRTSIIGNELFDKKSLLEWVISKKNSTINGFKNHFWNGVTCLTLSNIIKNIITNNLYWKGVRHIFSPDTVSKYKLCSIINEVYNLNINIKKHKTKYNNDKTLNTIYKTNSLFSIETLKNQIIQQKNFNLYEIGKYKNLSACRICNFKLIDIFSFISPLAGGFISSKKDAMYEKIYPTTLSFCSNCKTGQIKEIIEKDLLFTNINNNSYFYYSSTIPYLQSHFKSLANTIINNYNPKNILEIGCNDGVLLNQIFDINSNIHCVGVDPSDTIKNITNTKIKTYNTFFGDEITETLSNTYKYFDIITSSNCLAHMNNIDVIFKNMKRLLNKNGTILIEIHYFKNIIDNLNFDFIYHEHMSYYTISSFIKISKKYKYTIDNIELINIHGGSIRVHLKHYNNLFYINPNLSNLLDNEKNIGQDIKILYNKMHSWKQQILEILNKEKIKNNVIYGYGASGRTNTILSFIDFHFDYIFDDSKYKINNYTPYYHTEIYDSKNIYTLSNIKTIFILAWPYSKDIIKKHKQFLNNGGKFIIILPEIIEITKDNYGILIGEN